MILDEVNPHLLRALRYLMDEYGPTGVANVVELMRGPMEEPATEFTERRQHAAERLYTRDWPPPAPQQ